MTSRIFAAGVRVTAIANIVADVGAMITVQSDGTKRLNTASLRTYLDTQLLQVPSDKPPPTGVTTAMIAASLTVFPVDRFISELDSETNPDAFKTRSDWPLNYGTVTGAYLVGAIKTAISEAQTLSDLLTAHFKPLGDVDDPTLTTVIQQLYDAAGMDAIVPAAVDRIVNTRTYVYTYRTDKGEISAPSPASELVEIDQNDSVNVTASAPPSGRFIDSILWYRSNSSNTSDAFQFVEEVPVASGLTYNDTKLAEELEEPVPSFDWLEPPTNLAGMAMHPNGFLVGFFDNKLCFSVSERGYAWPSAYRKALRTPIVGVKISGTTIFVGTRGEPYLVSGVDPAFMTAERVNGGQACRSARGIVSTRLGIVYPGSDGLILCNGTQENPTLTQDHFTREYWESLNPESIFAIEHDGSYYFWWNNGANKGCFALGLDTGKLTTVDLDASAAFLNSSDDKLYAVLGSNISEVFGGTGHRTATWRTPRISGAAMNFSWRKVISDYEQGPITLKWNRFFRNGTSDVVTQTISSRDTGRLPPGRPDEYELEISGKSPVTLMAVTTDVGELKRV